MQSYQRLGITPPDITIPDELSNQIINIYYLVSRARRYEQATPLPLTVNDISEVVAYHSINLDRTLLDEIIFEIDNLVLEKNK